MDEFLKLLRAAWGLPEDADEAAVLAHATQLAAKPDPDPENKPDPAKPENKVPVVEPELAQLMEKSPAFKQFMEATTARINTVETDNAALRASNRLSEVKYAVSQLSEGSSHGLSPVQLSEATEVLIACSEDTSKKLLKLLADITKNGVVRLGEKAPTGPGNTNERNVGEVLAERVKKLMDADVKMTESDAYTKVFADDEALFEEYRKATYIREEV